MTSSVFSHPEQETEERMNAPHLIERAQKCLKNEGVSFSRVESSRILLMSVIQELCGANIACMVLLDMMRLARIQWAGARRGYDAHGVCNNNWSQQQRGPMGMTKKDLFCHTFWRGLVRV